MSGNWRPIFGEPSFPLQEPCPGPQFPTNVAGTEWWSAQTLGFAQPLARPGPEEIEEGEITATESSQRANDATKHQEYAPNGLSQPSCGPVMPQPFRPGTLFTKARVEGQSNSYRDNMLSVGLIPPGGPTSRSSALIPYRVEQVVRGPAMRDVDTRSLTASQVLFYFGVLTIQEPHIQPHFEFHTTENGKWWAKLNLYKDWLNLPTLRDTQMGAKVEICRVALSLLKPRYTNWKVPDEPSESLTAPEWNWRLLTEEHAKQNQMPSPLFTKYLHENGYRFEVTLPGVSAFGFRKFYVTEHEAADAAAHEGLYLLLTTGSAEAHDSGESALSMARNGRKIFSKAPSTASAGSRKVEAQKHVRATKSPSKNPLPHAPAKTESPNREERPFPVLHGTKKPRGRGSRRSVTPSPSNLDQFLSLIEPPQLINSPNFPSFPDPSRLPKANRIPLKNSRIQRTPVSNEPEKLSKWNITPRALRERISQKQTHVEKVDVMCIALRLHAKFEVRKSSDSKKERYSVWVTFSDDPFLARAGAIGKVDDIEGTEAAAKEACSVKVVEYLMKLVAEDAELEREKRQDRCWIENWDKR